MNNRRGHGPGTPYRVQRRLARPRPVGPSLLHQRSAPRTPRQQVTSCINLRAAALKSRYRGGRWK